MKKIIISIFLIMNISVQSQDHVVKMLNQGSEGFMVFEPAVLKISPGDSVTFEATDAAHNSASISGMIPEGAEEWNGGLSKDITVNATAVRVPVLIGHSESITIETESPIDIKDVISDFKDSEGIELIDNPDNDEYPTAFINGHGTDKVYVGRVRKSLNSDNILNIWVVADNVRKGAALNTVQIAELLIKQHI